MPSANITMGVDIKSREDILRHATLEEYIEANGGIDSFIEGLRELWKSFGLGGHHIDGLEHDIDSLQSRVRRMRL